MSEPKWVTLARQMIGLKEAPGPGNNPEIVKMWADIKRGGIKADATPWCAAFVGAVLERCGIQSSRFESAKSYIDWGIAIGKPVPGCIAVLSRDGGGHVGFVVGQDLDGRLLVLGGNQADMVCIKAFSRSRVIGFRWPANVAKRYDDLPVATADLSRGA